MDIHGYKRLAAVLIAALTTLFVACAVLLARFWDAGFKYGEEQREAKAVWNALTDYETTRNRLNKMGVEDTAAYLEIYAHSPANLKDRYMTMIIEAERQRLVRDIIAELRIKTGKDLGSNPELWIQRYRRDDPAASKHPNAARRR